MWNRIGKSLLPALIIGAMLTSCAPRVPFTQEVREHYKLTNEELKSLQFYASHDIVLERRSKNNKQKSTQEGTLTVKDGKHIEQVVIRAGTPGVVEKVLGDNRVAVSFETGDGKFLVFGDPTERNGVYKLLAGKWVNRRGKITYGGEEFLTSTSSSQVYLEFKMKQLREYRKDQRYAKGRKV